MKKMSDVTPARRGRPSKKNLITPKSAPAAIGEISLPSPTGIKVSDVQVSQTDADRPNISSKLKKRNGSRSASIDPTNIPKKKRCQKLADSTANPSSERSKSSSRTSSKEKTETLFSKTVKQEARKVAQKLKSQSTCISGNRKMQEKSRKMKRGRKKLGMKKLASSKSIKELGNELKDIHTWEMRKLLTTDGFWSSKASSRSNSPLGQPLEASSQKQAPVKKDSRTSTPDISPSSIRRQSIIKVRGDKEEAAAIKSNIPMSELRRLRTTDGFCYPDVAALSSRTGSRDVSPSSSSSLDRGTRQCTKSLNKGSENKNSVKSSEIDQDISVGYVSGKVLMKTKKEFNDANDKLSENQIEKSGTMPTNSSIVHSEKETHTETPVSRFRKKVKNSSDRPITIRKQKQYSSPVKHKNTSFVRRQKLKLESAVHHPVAGETDVFPMVPTSMKTQKVRKNAKLAKCSEVEKEQKSSLKISKAYLKRIQETISCVAHEIPELFLENKNVPEVSEAISLTNNVSSIKSLTSPELAISDLFDSSELKRLNTTTGFWATTPGVETVLCSSYNTRQRDFDSSSTKGSSDHLKSQEVKQTKFQQRAAGKPQSKLLQHRKKELRALQSTLRKIRNNSNEEPVEQNNSVETLSSSPPTDSVIKKRRSKKLSKFQEVDQSKNIVDKSVPKESIELLGFDIDTKETLESADSEINTNKTCESARSAVTNTKEILESIESQIDAKKTDDSEIDTKETKSEKLDIDIKDIIESQEINKVTLESTGLEVNTKEVTRSLKTEINFNKPFKTDCSDMSTPIVDTASSQLPVAKTRRRYRKKLMSGDRKVLSATNISGIKTRGSKKVESVVNKTLEVLQDLEANKDKDSAVNCSSALGTKRKLKRVKKVFHTESSLNKHVSGSETDMFPLKEKEGSKILDTEDKSNEIEKESITEISDKIDGTKVEQVSLSVNQTSGYKNDNLFESLGYNLLMPSGVSVEPGSYLSSCVKTDVYQLNESIDDSRVINSDLLADSCNQEQHDDVCQLEVMASSITLSDSNNVNIIHSGESFPGKVDGTKVDDDSVYQELVKDITIESDSITVDLNHSLSCADSSTRLEEPQSHPCQEEIVVQSIKLNIESSYLPNNNNSVEGTACEPSELAVLVDEGQSLAADIPTNKENLSVHELDSVDARFSLVDKKISQADPTNTNESSECSKLDSDLVSDVIKEKEQIDESKECKSSYFGVENVSEQNNVDSESRNATENISQDNDRFTTKQIGVSEDLKDSPSNEDLVSKSVEENCNILQSGDLKNDECTKIYNIDAESMTSHKIPIISDLDASGDKVLQCSETSYDANMSPTKGQKSAENIILQEQNIEEDAARFVTQKGTAVSDLPTPTSGLNIETEVFTFVSDNLKSSVETIVSEEILSVTKPYNETKKVRRRRRNAWKRGVLKKSAHLSRKRAQKKVWPARRVLSEKCHIETTVSNSLQDENNENQTEAVSSSLQDKHSENEIAVPFSPSVKKSLTNMLKKLQTNANLANAILDKSYNGRFLRNAQLMQPKRGKGARLNVQGNTDITQSASVDKMEELQIEIPGNSETVKRKRGRPKKQRDDSLPKLTPLNIFPVQRSVPPWNKTPPNLSPQALTPPKAFKFVDPAEVNNLPDSEFVCESVDDTDLHLYLSGVSEDEQSPKKDLLHVFGAVIHPDIPVFTEMLNENVCVQEAITDTLLETNEEFAVLKPEVAIGKEPKKPGRPKIKGRRGRPPGIPMTEEERRKKAQKIILNDEVYRDQDLLETLGASSNSTQIPHAYTSSDFTNRIDTPAAKFSLRQKSTRSPLEMIALKRKQEEAKYDLEQELRQARLIHLREKRSARESCDGFSEDGDGLQGPENILLCSVVLSDFVKKLQLDDIEASSGEEVSQQTSDRLSVAGASPDYNTFDNGDDEDWCADLEEHENDECDDSRPYIPRLKLKRVIKKGESSQFKRTKLKQLEQQHEPIKLLIKAEPEPNEQVGVKVSTSVESSKLDRSGFENSYMNFLRRKNEHINEKMSLSKRKYNTLKHSQCEKSAQKVADFNSREILSMSTVRPKELSLTVNKSLTETDGGVCEEQLPTISSNNVSTSYPLSSNVHTTVTSVDNLTNIARPGPIKRLSSVDEEDDDILILDLDDGAVDQCSEDMFREGLPMLTSSVTSVVQSPSEDMFREGLPILTSVVQSLEPDMNITAVNSNNVSQVNEMTDQEHEHTSKDNSAGENAVVRSTQRSYSNDEMGLMFESYNSQKEQDVQSHLHVGNTPNTSLESNENSGSCSGNISIAKIGESSKTLSCVVTEGACLMSAPKDNGSVTQISQSVSVTAVRPNIGLEGDKKDTSNAVVAAVMNTDASNVEYCAPGEISTGSMQQLDGDSMASTNKEVEQVLVDTVSAPSGDCAQSETSNSESLTDASDKTAGECPSDVATLEYNNINLGFKSQPKLSAQVKKPGLVNDNSRSPKHPIYHGSGSEEWKVKVILNSDKFPSGKYSCKRCDFPTSSKLAIESHIYSHIPGVQFRCAYCESEFSSMAATSSHLKNTHSLSEAKLQISRHIDEKNFYEKEDAVFSDESNQQSAVQTPSANTSAGGQSPPVIISVVVSGGVGSSRGVRPSAPPRRFVCTHCGFSTNVKEGAEHHVLDLHSTQALFACLLCSENVCYTECEIKDHCATVHPARHHPYRKLPDFYDAEQLNLKEKAASQDDRENIFERMTSIFQDEPQTTTSAIDHRQKAKEYLYLQEGWREKTRVEADSTTAVDYTEEHDNMEAQSAPETPTPEESMYDSNLQVDVAENEASDQQKCSSQLDAEDVTEDVHVSETTDAFITSSAGSTIKISNVISHALDFNVSPEAESQQDMGDQEETMSQLEPAIHSVLEAASEDHIQGSCHVSDHIIEDNGEDMGLKIIQVVSLSGQGEDILDEQISTDQPPHEQMDTDTSVESGTNFQTNAEDASTSSHGILEHSPANSKETVVQKEMQSSPQKLQTSEHVATESLAPDATSSITNPSFAGGLPLSYKCNACKVHTPYLLMMVKHLKAKHPNMRCFSCPYCKTTHSFVSQKQLRHHVKQSHPNKFGRNEIALSEDAKKFVEAMVLPMGPECIRVGNRIVLEEDIHTCTYCQLRMVSLTSVYQHLNTKHMDLFEFVCPVCQNFKSKLLTEISVHCLETHKSTLDTDKVHVSVPKNLFTALTCISKNGKYIEKSLATCAAGIEKATTSSATFVTELSERTLSSSVKLSQVSIAASESQISAQSSQRLASAGLTSTVPTAVVSASQTSQPGFPMPLVSVGTGAVTTARTVVAFSSSLFDTSSLTATPQLTTASQPIPIVHSAAASSFLSPIPQQTHVSSQQIQSSKQLSSIQPHPRPNEKPHGPIKNLPVLNVPTIKPRASSLATKSVAGGRRSVDHTPADVMPKNIPSPSNSIATLLTASVTNQHGIRRPGSPSCMHNLPDDEPNPDAFKIFNLRPSSHHTSPSSASPTVSPNVPSVFPPVSSPMTSGYIQGAMTGFPPGMVISQNLLPLSFPFPQHQTLVHGMLSQHQNPQSSPLSRHLNMPHPSSVSMSAQHSSVNRNSISQHEAAAATSVYLKKQQQQRELYHLKKQHELLRHNQQLAVARAHPAHQQPPSLSGQMYQPQPLPMSSMPYDHQQLLPGPSNMPQSSLFLSPVSASSSCAPSSSAQMRAPQSSSPVKPTKGVHKRSSSLYQCPYCPVLVTLRALEVASHIQQHHPGKQVTFRKIA